MKKIAPLFIGLIVTIIACNFFVQKNESFDILVFSKTAGYRHASIGAGQDAIFMLGHKNGFSVDTTEDASVFTTEKLQKYKAIVFLNTTGDVLDEQQQTVFQSFIQKGGGFVGIHSASDTEYDWPWYGKMVGAYFDGHPNDPNVREASSHVVDTNHICTKHLPETWTRLDEWYNYKDINPAIKVLLNLDESTYEGGTNGANHPICWYHDYNGGRAWYTGMGHTAETFSEPLFLEHLWGGVQYATGQ